MADVNVTFDASDEGLTAAVKRFQDELKTLDAQAITAGRKLSEAFEKLNISQERGFKLASPEDRNNLVQYNAAMELLRNTTGELSEETQKAGTNMGAMLTRMVERMAVFEAVRIGFKMLTDEFKEVVGFESARVGFEAMTVGARDATEAEKIMDQTAKETGIEHEKLYAAVISLENAGEGPKKAASEVELLGKFAAATHGDVDKMSKALSDIRLGTASVQEMFDLAHRTGEAKDEMVGLVTEYANLQREVVRTDHARTLELATMREQAAETERAIADQQKLAGVQESFLEKMLAAAGKPPGQADPVLARAMSGELPQTPGGRQMTADIAAGFQRIYDEENLSTAGMQHFVDTGVIGMREILAAAGRVHAAEKEARTSAIEGLAKEDAAAKEGEKAELDQKRLELADKFSAAVNNKANAEEIYAKWAATAEGSLALSAAHAKEIREQSDQAALATKAIASLWEGINKGGGLPPIGGVVMTGRAREAALGAGTPGAAGGKLMVKDDNSDESVRLLHTIADHLSGQGTP